MPLDVVWASEWIVPATGGAERTTLAAAGALAARGHLVRLVCVDGVPAPDAAPVPAGVEVEQVVRPAAPAGYWAGKRMLCEAVGAGVTASLDRRPADVVVAHLHAAPAALAAAGPYVPTVLAVMSYEPLCRYAFDPGSACGEWRDCERCPAARRLGAAERQELRRSRRTHEHALVNVTALIAETRTLADVVEAWSGRRPVVLPPPISALGPCGARFDGHVLLAANRWSAHKGVELLAALTRAVLASGREVRITRRGLGDSTARGLREAGATIVENQPLPALLAGASALLVPSQWDEPFGRIAWEAMSAGLPVLASDAGGMAEYVPPAQRVSPRDQPQAWERELSSLFADRTAWTRACVAGPAAAGAVLAGPPPGERLESLLASVAGGARCGG